MPRTYPLDFLLAISPDLEINTIKVEHEFPSFSNLDDRNTALLYLPNNSKFKISNHASELAAIGGDPIGLPDDLSKIFASNEFNPGDFLNHVSGHYYLIYQSHKDNGLLIASSQFSIFPIFWYQSDECMLIASRLQLMLDFLPSRFQPNQKFIVEQLLFNYPLFNDTILKNVRLCPSNHYIKIAKGIFDCVKHQDVTALFVDHPKQWRDSADDLTSLFLTSVKNYFPGEKSAISFTGGFDGRTLVACAKHFGQQFTTFSFGTRKNDDVTVPMRAASKLGIEYTPILLDEPDYIEKYYDETGKELIDLTSGMSSYLYVHFLYSAKKLSNESNYLLVGYFGSELFRALHLTGAMISKELFSFFQENDGDRWISTIRNSSKLKYLNKEFVQAALDGVIEELRKYKNDYAKRLNKCNHFFYKFVLEEIFRKFFGTLIFSQSNFINVRTPFLDQEFIRELFKTEFAGVNHNFFIHNPLKRMTGQYLYAAIIAHAYPELAILKTQRGYRPQDLLTVLGTLNIILPYLQKKIRRKVAKPFLDNLSIISGIRHNWQAFRREIISHDCFDITELDKLAGNLDNIPEYQRDLLALAASSSMVMNQIAKR